MRNHIISSVANAIGRYRAQAIDMLRANFGSPVSQWHTQLCAVVQPAGDAHQKCHRGLLTSVVKVNDASIDLNRSPLGLMANFLERVNERLFEGTIGSNGQFCPAAKTGSLGSNRVS